MAERAIFLDRDNTIIEDKEGYLGDPAKVKLLPGAAAAIAAMRELGYRIIVVSNQSGVARGKFNESAVEAVNQEMCRQLRAEGGAEAKIDASYYCPYHPTAVLEEFRQDHPWRKPKPGMLLQAAEDFKIDLKQSWMIGDMQRDIAAGVAVGCRTILLRDPAQKDTEAAKSEAKAETQQDKENGDGENGAPRGGGTPNFVVQTLIDAARVVAREEKNPHPGLLGVPLGIQVPTKESKKGNRSGGSGQAGHNSGLGEQQFAEITASILSLRGQMSELAGLVRAQQTATAPAEFSFMRMLATMAQVLVFCCVGLGIWEAFTAWNAIGGLAPEEGTQVVHLIKAGIWLVGGAILQGFTATFMR